MANSASMFLVTLILTRHMGKADFGNYSLYYAAIFTLWPFVGLSTHFYLQSRFSNTKIAGVRLYFSSLLLVNIMLFVCVEILFFLFLNSIGNTLELSKFWILSIPGVSLALCVIRLGLLIFQLSDRLSVFLLLTFTQVAINIAMTLYLVLVIGTDWEGRGLALLVSSVFAAVLVLCIALKDKIIRLNCSWAYIKNILTFGFAAIALDICIVGVAFSDKFFVKYILDTETLGVFSVGLQLAVVVSVIDSAAMQALYPHIYKLLGQGRFGAVVRLSLIYLSALTAFAFLYGSLSPYIFQFIIPFEFNDAYSIMKFSLVSLIFVSAYKLAVAWMYHFRISKSMIYPSLFILLLNIILHENLISIYGVMAAVAVNVFSYAALAFSVFLVTFYFVKSKNYSEK